eukprot:7206272-Pyramimonas_sp.AAC.1
MMFQDVRLLPNVPLEDVQFFVGCRKLAIQWNQKLKPHDWRHLESSEKNPCQPLRSQCEIM